jgi:hypothetical protein
MGKAIAWERCKYGYLVEGGCGNGLMCGMGERLKWIGVWGGVQVWAGVG